MKLVLLKRKEPFYTVFTETNSYARGSQLGFRVYEIQNRGMILASFY